MPNNSWVLRPQNNGAQIFTAFIWLVRTPYLPSKQYSLINEYGSINSGRGNNLCTWNVCILICFQGTFAIHWQRNEPVILIFFLHIFYFPSKYSWNHHVEVITGNFIEPNFSLQLSKATGKFDVRGSHVETHSTASLWQWMLFSRASVMKPHIQNS